MSQHTYKFSLAVTGLCFENDDQINALHPNCADAIITRHNRNVFIEFERTDASYQAAVLHAILDVEKNSQTVHVHAVDNHSKDKQYPNDTLNLALTLRDHENQQSIWHLVNQLTKK
jgi:hypothetical protein